MKFHQIFYRSKGIRLSLISSETAITTLLFLLCLCKRKWIYYLQAISPKVGLQTWPCCYLACYQISQRFSVVLIYFNWRIFLRRWVAIYDEFATTYQLNLEPKFQDFLNVVSFASSVLVHDAIYQFLRIFYQSRFKPDTLR